jgi:hypothetical protein
MTAMTTTMMQPNVHILEFNDGNNPISNPDHFNVLWQIDTRLPPRRQSASEPNVDEWGGMVEGDLVLFPSLLSGAGEFEAVRFVGRGTDDAGAAVLPLLTAGVEYPEFPTLVVAMAAERGASLREMYEAPFHAILHSQPPGLSLVDLFSNDEEAYEEFWDDVPVARRRRPPGGSPWQFSLGDCSWIQTLTFGAGSRTGVDEL